MHHGTGTEIRYHDPSSLPKSMMAKATTDSNVYTVISNLPHKVSHAWNWIERDRWFVFLYVSKICNKIGQNCSTLMHKNNYAFCLIESTACISKQLQSVLDVSDIGSQTRIAGNWNICKSTHIWTDISARWILYEIQIWANSVGNY